MGSPGGGGVCWYSYRRLRTGPDAVQRISSPDPSTSDILSLSLWSRGHTQLGLELWTWLEAPVLLCVKPLPGICWSVSNCGKEPQG